MPSASSQDSRDQPRIVPSHEIPSSTAPMRMPMLTTRRHVPAGEFRSRSAVETQMAIASGLKPASTSRVSSAWSLLGVSAR